MFFFSSFINYTHLPHPIFLLFLLFFLSLSPPSLSLIARCTRRSTPPLSEPTKPTGERAMQKEKHINKESKTKKKKPTTKHISGELFICTRKKKTNKAIWNIIWAITSLQTIHTQTRISHHISRHATPITIFFFMHACMRREAADRDLQCVRLTNYWYEHWELVRTPI